MVTKADVEKLALTDPIVNAHLYMQRRGLVTWDEMMCALVVGLVEAKNAFQATALDYAKRMPARPMILQHQLPMSEE